jgi:ribosomal protein L11 methylase PrmA
LCIGKVRILAAGSQYNDNDDNDDDNKDDDKEDDLQTIRLLVGRNGWGTGIHPTTRLCLEWVCDTVQGGEVLLDYGCGSGILSIAALHMGAARCVGVDVEAEALVSAERNVHLNGYSEARYEGLHTREVVPYALCTPLGVDICVANILIGQLVRGSMVSAIVSNLVPGALLCLSGIRPDEVDSLKAAYKDHMEWLDDEYAELSASETEGSLESYGFDCGRWARLVGRKTAGAGRDHDIQSMSELAVS